MKQLLASSPNRKWFILFSVSIGVFMSSLDASIVNIALPQITNQFHATLSTVEWVVMIYLLFISSLLLTYGRLGDMYGHKPLYLAGFAVFTVASALNSFAPSIGILIASRALQALGGGMIMAVVQALISATFDPSERGKAIGINAVMVSLGLAFGPTIGGFLISNFPWQSIFIVNIPIGIIGTVLVWLIVPYQKGTPQKFDFGGAVLSFGFLSGFLFALSQGQAWGWFSRDTLGLLLASVLMFGGFVYLEKKIPYPMIKLELFKIRLFSAANFAAMLNYLTQYVVTFIMPFYLLTLVQMPSDRAGLIMSAFPLAAAAAAPFSGTLSDKIGSRILTSLGMALIAVAVTALSSEKIVANIALIPVCLMVAGLGNGLFLSPNNNAIMGCVPKAQSGIASGMLATMRCVGQVLGVAISGAVFSSRSAFYTTQLKAAKFSLATIAHQSFMWALRDTYLVAGAVAVIGVIICWGRGNSYKQQTQALNLKNAS